ncbi:MAG: carboxymuconolactone decarboxylase [Spirochaetae bacterium HGW-Spirochaetae-7]|jgi:uncharacterized peroxidase-related enzyme|nr:MAG: carboxymuconolactone decarboxylase [Spirochaetae bacterium HGW-Spirochaetae-7]
MNFDVHTIETSPESAKLPLAEAVKGYGFLPNMIGVMSEAPALLKAYRALSELFGQTSLSRDERNVVMLTVSRENGCEYCVAAHTGIATMQRVPAEVVNAIRDGKPISDARLEAIRAFTAALVHSRGFATESQLEAFIGAGYTKAQVLEVVLGIGFKTLSNYTNHLAHTPLDPKFAAAAWKKED